MKVIFIFSLNRNISTKKAVNSAIKKKLIISQKYEKDLWLFIWVNAVFGYDEADELTDLSAVGYQIQKQNSV